MMDRGRKHPKPGWASHSLSIASDELDSVHHWLECALGFAEDLRLQVEDADKAFAAACEPHEVFWMQLADDGESIRRWSRTPFEGARQCRVALPHTPEQT